MPELAAWHVDRLLGFYRKPPIASRTVSSKMLYPSFITSLLPDYAIHVTVHGWIDKLKNQDPSTDLMKYIVSDNLVVPQHSELRENILSMSDVLLFDYLVDDHDRRAEKNWIYRYNFLLAWDNGLAWDHGPVGDSECLDILCGRLDFSLPSFT